MVLKTQLRIYFITTECGLKSFYGILMSVLIRQGNEDKGTKVYSVGI